METPLVSRCTEGESLQLSLGCAIEDLMLLFQCQQQALAYEHENTLQVLDRLIALALLRKDAAERELVEHQRRHGCGAPSV